MNKEVQKAYKRRLGKLEIRAAYYGINAPPEVLMEIEDIQEVLFKKKLSH
jgi:hypothetical protein